MPVICGDIGHDVLPRNDEQDVQIEPPSQQQSEIETSDTGGIFVARSVGTDGQGGHERNNVQEQNDVPGEQVRDIGVQDHFVVGPEQLINEPERDAESDQGPEQAHASLRAKHQRNEGGGTGNQKEALNDIAEGGQLKRARQKESSENEGRQ